MKVSSVMSLFRHQIWRRSWGPTWSAVEDQINFWTWGRVRGLVTDRIERRVARQVGRWIRQWLGGQP